MATTSSISHKIKNRDVAKDVFITPRALAKKHIETINANENDKWLDPCRYNVNGSYYSQFPCEDSKKTWCEITEGTDFFKSLCQPRPTIICCNPPYSILDKWFKRCIELNPRVISVLIGVGNLTARRIEMFETAGYGLTHLTMLKVYQWYGMSYIVNFEKDKPSIMSIDRTVWK